MSHLTAEQHQKLTEAIQSLEREVAGEVVVVVAETSDSYRYIPMLWAALAAIVFPALYLLWGKLFGFDWLPSGSDQVDFMQAYPLQIAVFLGLLLLLNWPLIHRRVIPREVQRHRASRLARDQFLAQRLHHTSNRCGAMVFISRFEHYVEILVDKGLADKVGNDYWATTIEQMSAQLKNERIDLACHLAIEAIAKKLKQHAQRDETSPPPSNELPDHVIEL